MQRCSRALVLPLVSWPTGSAGKTAPFRGCRLPQSGNASAWASGEYMLCTRTDWRGRARRPRQPRCSAMKSAWRHALSGSSGSSPAGHAVHAMQPAAEQRRLIPPPAQPATHLHQAAYYAERIVQRAVGLCQREFVGAAQQYGGGTPLILDPRDLHHLAALAQLRGTHGCRLRSGARRTGQPHCQALCLTKVARRYASPRMQREGPGLANTTCLAGQHVPRGPAAQAVQKGTSRGEWSRQGVCVCVGGLLTSASSTSAAWPSFSGRMWSTCAMGRQCSVLEMNSMSSRSTSLITRILALACVCGVRVCERQRERVR